LPLLFALTLFLSAALLFWVQPMFARLVLPLLGGTPAVWNTCVLFFQAALLAGYGYSHLTPAALGVRRQTLLQLVLMLLPLAFLPIGVPEALGARPDYFHPSLWLLLILLLGVGLPFFAVSTSAPLLQRWFAATGHPAARDPYFLYAASNLGSMIGLLSYPFILEPLLPLDDQTGLWMYLYWGLAGLVAVCAVIVLKSEIRNPKSEIRNPKQAGSDFGFRISDFGFPAGSRLLWILLAFVPSSLMLSVTTYLTTDVAPIPLLWVIPLALYLLTFILAFAPRPLAPLAALHRTMPLVVIVVVLILISEAAGMEGPIWLMLAIHSLALFWIALWCHGTLARLRPDPRHLTEFYFWLSLGGVLGGLFNALIAPLVFSRITEYPLVLVVACLLRAANREQGTGNREQQKAHSAVPCSLFPVPSLADLLFPLAVGVLTVLLVLLARSTGIQAGPLGVAVVFAAPAVICYTFQAWPLRFGLAVGVLLLASTLYPGIYGYQVEYRQRNFFGVHKVVLFEDAYGHKYRRLIHGTTVHGQQSLEPWRRGKALVYFHESGPIGQVFRFLKETGQPPRNVGIVGLGAGSLAAYAQPGQHWTFYEIDPEVIYLARDSGYFTFLKDCRAGMPAIIEGDARLRLAQSEDRYDLLIIDAFSSDALPVHLFTREALEEVYLKRLRPKGLIAFHISSRYLDLAPVLGRLADQSGLPCRIQRDLMDDPQTGKFASDWVIMAHPAGPVAKLRSAMWEPLHGGPDAPLWTDDHTNILPLLK
jgi:hypothetical protein